MKRTAWGVLLTALLASVGMTSGRNAFGAEPTPLAPPTPSLPATSDAGRIGLIERNRKSDPSVLLPYLRNTDPAIAARAALALGRLGNPAGEPALSHVLEDRGRAVQVRAMAAFGLGLLGSQNSVGVLSVALRDPNAAVAGAAADALGRIGGSAAIDALIPMLVAPDEIVRSQSAVALGEAALPGAPAIGFAQRKNAAGALAVAIQRETDPEVRWREAWALGRAYYQMQAPVLRRLLGDGQELVRLYAVEGLGRLHDRTYDLPVRLLAHDASWRVRVEVRNALQRMRDRTAVSVTPPPVPDQDLATPAPLPSSAPFGPHPQVAFVTTKGVIVVELFPDAAPYSVDNFLSLVDRGFYNNLSFFRVIEDFVIQGGDPQNTGSGGPGYTVPSERNPIQQLTGIISYGLDYDTATNQPILDSAGSQYYITQSPQLHLDRAFTVFGRVVKGMAVVDAIAPHAVGDTAPADVARRVYRCRPVTDQTPHVEELLRTAEVGYDAH